MMFQTALPAIPLRHQIVGLIAQLRRENWSFEQEAR